MMSVYADADQLYGCLRALFDRIEAEEARAAETLLKSRLQIRLRCSEPTAEITFDARKRPLQIIYGSNSHRPDLDVVLAADTLHYILLGELSLKKALGRKLLKPKGPVWKVTTLADLFHRAQRIYPQVLGENELG